MNNKSFIQELSRRTGMTQDGVQKAVYSLVDAMNERLQEGGTVNIVNFGTFEVKKRLERVIVNPGTGQRMLVPPKLVLSFRPAAALKEWVNSPKAADGVTLPVKIADGDLPAADHRLSTALFVLVADGLLTDERLVKVRGLGTFKIVNIKDRESISVNTGERITIEGRGKVAFLPDNVIRDLVNKPFSQFDTVVLNDGVDFSGIDDTNDGQPVADEEKATDVPPVADGKETTEELPAADEQETVTVAEDDSGDSLPEEQSTDDDLPQDDEPSATVSHNVLWMALIVIVVAAAMFCLGYYVGMNHRLSPTDTVETGDDSTQVTAVPDTLPEPSHEDDSISTEPATGVDAGSGEETVEPQPAEDTPELARARNMVRLGAYTITGTQETVTVRRGQTMKRISKYYLGDGMECYLQVHNNCTEVTEGMTLNIPSLKVKGRKTKN